MVVIYTEKQGYYGLKVNTYILTTTFKPFKIKIRILERFPNLRVIVAYHVNNANIPENPHY